MTIERCEGCGRRERCEYCGRFMAHMWASSGYEYPDWEDWWECSQEANHRLDHPDDYIVPTLAQQGTP